MTDDHRSVRRGLALGVAFIFAATVAALVLAPSLASARGSNRDHSSRTNHFARTMNANRTAANFDVRGSVHDHGVAIDATASLTGTTSDDVKTALEGGQTLASYAEAHGVSTAALVDGIVAAESARIDQAVADEMLTQQQADEMKSGLNDRVTAQVNRTGGPGGCPGMQRKEHEEGVPTQST